MKQMIPPRCIFLCYLLPEIPSLCFIPIHGALTQSFTASYQNRNSLLLLVQDQTQHMAAFAPIYNPGVPFQSAFLGGITEGRRVTIQGQAHSHAKRFAVNFVCFNNDIAFHFNPRFDDGNVIVCNTMQKSCWGPEERKSNMPFQRKSYFDISILVLGHGFQVTVNGKYLLEYRHRIAYQNIQSLQIVGDLILSCVTFSPSHEMSPAPPPYTPGYPQNPFVPPMCGVPVLPSMPVPPVFGAPMPQKAPMTVYNPVMPFQAALQKNFGQRGNIIIMGNIAYGADRFHVNLLNSRTRNIHLHINPRFREGAFVRNTQDRGTWGPEERQISYMPFHPGQSFQLEIKNEGGSFGVYSNGNKLFNYVHRLPFNQIDMIEVGGDVTLTFVQY
ncbi:galectin-4-like [Dendropsophus ebraccatus]|uniref:galectin-4-like n=1 Tax=Dendropsophus ebraccatus TaxID=150705 RepID=UPI0038320893